MIHFEEFKFYKRIRKNGKLFYVTIPKKWHDQLVLDREVEVTISKIVFDEQKKEQPLSDEEKNKIMQQLEKDEKELIAKGYIK